MKPASGSALKMQQTLTGSTGLVRGKGKHTPARRASLQDGSAPPGCTQVGCAMACTFCATGKAGFARNLAAHEILDQVMVVGEAFKARVSHVVYMGQGEATLNLRNVLKSVDLIRDQLGIGARR